MYTYIYIRTYIYMHAENEAHVAAGSKAVAAARSLFPFLPSIPDFLYWKNI